MNPCLPPLAGLALLVVPISDDGPAPNSFSVATWLNYVGQPPQLDHFEGRAVLVHFLSTNPDDEIQKQANWQVVRRHWNEFADKGVVFLGVARESAGEVRKYIEEHNVPFPVAVGCDAHDRLSAGGPFYEILFDRKGERYWEGPTNGLWNGKLLKGAKGSGRPGPEAALALHLGTQHGKTVKGAVEDLAGGDLKGALKKLDGILAKDSSRDEARDAATAVWDQVSAHVERLLQQVERAVESGEVQVALPPLEELAGQLKRHELGAAAIELFAAYEADPWIQKQLEAAERFEDLMGDYWRLGFGKTEARFQKLIDGFPETAAARKAKNHLSTR